MARIAEWDRPLKTGSQRLRAWLNMIFVDHGIFRILYLNKHQVNPRFWRAAQPTPGHIRVMSYQGIKTIINLRAGREHGSWPLEKETCFECRITLMEFVLRSRGAPDKESLLELPAFFDSLTYPVLVHCKSGADRAGLMSALYLLIHERKSAAEAALQLSYRYGHFRFAKTGILDAFIEDYAKNGEAKGIHFLDWVKNYYDPAQLEANFKPSFFSKIVVDGILKRE
jgi:protein tyrosine/serine phosphatase